MSFFIISYFLSSLSGREDKTKSPRQPLLGRAFVRMRCSRLFSRNKVTSTLLSATSPLHNYLVIVAECAVESVAFVFVFL